MIGYYNPSVILTYMGFIFAVIGINHAANGEIKGALLCLMICGLCDMFDGSIAKLIKRSDNEKQFGIQIDSLCDMVCFGVFPAVICYFAAEANMFRIIAMAVYMLAAVIRLAYFNVMAITSPVEVYRGMPVTTAAGFFPLFMVLISLLKLDMGMSVSIFMIVMAISFIGDFPMKKAGKTGKIIIVIAGVAVLSLVLIYGNALNAVL